MTAAVTFDLTDVQTLLVSAAALLVAWGVLWRGLLKPVWVRVKTIHDLIEHELKPNGGSSMKDATTLAAEAVGEAVAAARRAESTALALREQVDALNVKLSETRHDVIGQFATLSASADGAKNLVEAIVRTSNDLRSVRAELATLKNSKEPT